MVNMHPVRIGDVTAVAIEVRLPKTNLLAVTTGRGYVMCGALDIQLLRDKLADRGIVAARAVGVRTIEELIDGTVESCTQAAEAMGIQPGMPVREAVRRMVEAS
ncbi:DUF1805 domain-containing protein [Alicyclobacillus sp.]|uniref:YunC family protein n=1 Tax=Alicyclobacillus sp. TaxID=61169 RepID=UPI0025C0D982|nr:DUF1805 domain-containing protein [Alicyclobacillus sp.]MCL6515430.1 DUF1805 domain-containing protein [Alicyclobacillus sp.]